MQADGSWPFRGRPSGRSSSTLTGSSDPSRRPGCSPARKVARFGEAVWQQEWARARGTVGLPDLHFHDLRHLAATLAVSTGAGVKEIMYRIGHSSSQAALRYQHASQQRDRTIADGISGLIQSECG